MSSPDMVDEIYEYISNLHGNHTLCYFMNDCRIILKQNKPSEGSDVRSSKKREQQMRQQPQCHDRSSLMNVIIFLLSHYDLSLMLPFK